MTHYNLSKNLLSAGFFLNYFWFGAKVTRCCHRHYHLASSNISDITHFKLAFSSLIKSRILHAPSQRPIKVMGKLFLLTGVREPLNATTRTGPNSEQSKCPLDFFLSYADPLEAACDRQSKAVSPHYWLDSLVALSWAAGKRWKWSVRWAVRLMRDAGFCCWNTARVWGGEKSLVRIRVDVSSSRWLFKPSCCSFSPPLPSSFSATLLLHYHLHPPPPFFIYPSSSSSITTFFPPPSTRHLRPLISLPNSPPLYLCY